MKMNKLHTGLLLIFLMLFVSCMKEDSEPSYSVWTYAISNSEYPGSIDNGNYIQVELTNSEFNDLSSTLTSDHNHKWIEEQIYNWFIGRDFIPYEANQKTAWLITANHCMLTSRSGNMVYRIIK